MTKFKLRWVRDEENNAFLQVKEDDHVWKHYRKSKAYSPSPAGDKSGFATFQNAIKQKTPDGISLYELAPIDNC